MALALSATTGIARRQRVLSSRILSASMPLMPGRLMSIRMTSGMERARHLDTADAVRRTEQADVGPALEQVLDQHQVGRVVLDA